jgi:hypothetical protein
MISGMSQITYDRELAREIIHIGDLAADMEALKPRPFSSVRTPDGSAQYETGSEYTRRIIGCAISHLLRTGLLVIADDAREKMERGIPLDL